MLPWKLQKRHILPVNQNLSSVYFSVAKFELVSATFLFPWFGKWHTAISKKVVGKSARDNPERHYGWFWVHCSSEKFERMARKSIKMCSRVLTESNKSRLDSYSRQEQCIDHIPYYLTGLSRAHFFPTTFLEIAVYTQTAKTVFSHLKHFNLTVTLNHRLVSLAGRVTC